MKPRMLMSPDSTDAGGDTAVEEKPVAGGIPGTNDEFVEVPETKVEGEKKNGDEGGEDESDDTTGLTRDDITAILQEVIPAAQPQPVQQQPERQYTQEEYDRYFNVFKPDEILLQRLRAEDPKVAMEALVAIRDGLIRQAMTMAEIRTQQLLGDLRSKELAPISDYVSEARASALRDEFFSSNEDLAPYDAIVEAVSMRMEQNGMNFNGNKQKMFAEMAKQSRAVVKQLLAKNGGQQNASGGGGARRSKMSTVSAGGQGGGGRTQSTTQGGTLPKTVADGLAVFD